MCGAAASEVARLCDHRFQIACVEVIARAIDLTTSYFHHCLLFSCICSSLKVIAASCRADLIESVRLVTNDMRSVFGQYLPFEAHTSLFRQFYRTAYALKSLIKTVFKLTFITDIKLIDLKSRLQGLT